jgi:GWxTD domain-containing protein
MLQAVDDSASTVVEGMFRVDPALLGGAACDYTAIIEFKDARGASLSNPDKRDHVCPTLQDGTMGAALERFHFAMPLKQTFTVDITVYPKDRPKEKHVRTLKITALDRNSFASDLVLGNDIGVADTSSGTPWTLQRPGGVGISAASETIVDPSAPRVAYYFELYPHGKTLSGSVWGVVKRPDGVQVGRFPLQTLDTISVFRTVAGKAELAGLAPGSYIFNVELALGDTTLILSHPFQMSAPPAAASTAGTAASGYFSTVSDADMVKYNAAAVWLTSKAQSDLFNSLTVAGKREYLNKFFGPEMPTPNDGRETSDIDRFVTRAEVVDKRYSEKAGRGQQPGWQTARGRIYMLHGEPNSLIHQQSPRSGAPYDIFFYQTGKGLAYVFADDTRLGQYRLIWTNDPNEQGVGGIGRVGPEAQEDLQRLGIRVSNQ